ncbi:acetyltransferase GCN5 [Bryobacterales bacterium F-183]|nr:acetyltransferase GCN5 [Bryobacterales bacterium F-183]
METLPIGPLVESTAAAPRPSRVTLTGRYVTLEPLDAAKHADSIFELQNGLPDLWLYLADEPYTDRGVFRAAIEKKAASEDPLFYAVVLDGRAVGYCSLMRIDPANRVIEIGNILYTPALQRTCAATEAMYLMAKYAFDELGYRRYEWKCNSHNAPSHRAARRYGFVYEGTFRQHLIIKGRNRDTAWYSMLDSEWPARKAAFERWLDPANFDGQGRQITPLSI